MDIYPDLKKENVLYAKGFRSILSETSSSPDERAKVPLIRKQRARAVRVRAKAFAHGWATDLWKLAKSHWEFIKLHYWFTVFTFVFALLTILFYKDQTKQIGCSPSNYIARDREVLKGSIGFNCKERSSPLKMMCPAPFNPLISTISSDGLKPKVCKFDNCIEGARTTPVKRWLFYNDVEVVLHKDVVLVDRGDKVTWPGGPHRNGSLFEVWVTFCTPRGHLSKLKEMRYRRICEEVGCNIASLVDPESSGPSSIGKLHDSVVKTCGELTCVACKEFTLWLLCLPTVKFIVETLLVVLSTLVVGYTAKQVHNCIKKFTTLPNPNNMEMSPIKGKEEDLEEVIEEKTRDIEKKRSGSSIRPPSPSAPAAMGVLASLVGNAYAQEMSISHSAKLDLSVTLLVLFGLVIFLKCRRSMFCPTMMLIITVMLNGAKAMNTAMLSNTLCTSTDCTSRALIALQPDSTFTILSGKGSKAEKIQVSLTQTYFTPSIQSLYFTHDGKLTSSSPDKYNFCNVEECNKVEFYTEFSIRTCECVYGLVFNEKVKTSFNFESLDVYEIGEIKSWQAKYQLRVMIGNHTEVITLLPGQTSEVLNVKIWSGSTMYSPPINKYLMKNRNEMGWTRLVHNASPIGGPIAGLVGWNQCAQPNKHACKVDRSAYGCTFSGCHHMFPNFETATQPLPLKIDKGTMGPGGTFSLDYGQSALFTIESKEPLHSELGGVSCQLERSSVGGVTNTHDGVEVIVMLSDQHCEFLLTVSGFTHFFVSSSREHKSYWTLPEGFDRDLVFVSGKFNSSNVLLGEVKRGLTLNDLVTTGYLSGSPISGLVNHLEFGTLAHFLSSGTMLAVGAVALVALRK